MPSLLAIIVPATLPLLPVPKPNFPALNLDMLTSDAVKLEAEKPKNALLFSLSSVAAPIETKDPLNSNGMFAE